MRKLIATIVTAGMLSVAGLSGANAAAVPGFEDLYDAVMSSCTLPNGSVAACEVALNAYSGALVTAVDLPVANQSFSEARAEAFAANAADPAFQTEIDNLFELLLPDSGALGLAASPV